MLRECDKLNLADLDRAYLCVVQLATQPQLVLHQVTLRPDKCFNGLIRLGETPGDEAAGWMWPDVIEVVAVLGYAVQNGDTWQRVPLNADVIGEAA